MKTLDIMLIVALMKSKKVPSRKPRLEKSAGVSRTNPPIPLLTISNTPSLVVREE